MSIEAMKQALEALETATHQWEKEDAITSLRQAIAEAEKQEPVGHADLEINNIYLFNDQEKKIVPTGRQPLYTHPPKREWVGLTDEDMFQIADQCGLASVDWTDVMQAVQAKLKEKNT